MQGDGDKACISSAINICCLLLAVEAAGVYRVTCFNWDIHTCYAALATSLTCCGPEARAASCMVVLLRLVLVAVQRVAAEAVVWLYELPRLLTLVSFCVQQARRW